MSDREDTEALTGEIETLLENELRDDPPLDPSWLAVWVMDLVKPHVRARVADAWDEGYRHCFRAEEDIVSLTDNPYREGSE